jgi:Uma2 family endonuclease
MVLQKPMPNAEHADLQYYLVAYRKTHGGRTGPERRVRLRDAPSYRLPDTAYWVAGVPSGNDTVPTLAVEVRSPDQTMTELRAKCRAYRAGGVEVCWLFDPADRTVEVFEGRRDGETIPPHAKLESPFLPGFSDDLFSVLGRE